MATVSISLTQGKVATIDEEDYPLISRYTWHAIIRKRTSYAETYNRYRKHESVYREVLWMHRLIMDAPDGVEVDHINGNGLDNRRENLRLATRAQNGRNIVKQTPPVSSKYKGVSFQAKRGKWQVSIKVDGVPLFLGRFDDEIAAAHAYDAAARIHHGAFASLNFPDDASWSGETYVPHEPESGYRGVRRNGKRYMARVRIPGETIYAGNYATALEAAHAHDAKARALLGARAKLNFPD